ncbi:MAG: hypothetical protein HEP71_23425 [Roseivirga sp.]|nr:hypothetical protein [Roseivirga sp.]
MIKDFLSHGFLQVRRSPVWAKSLITNLMLGLFGLMMVIYMLLLGVFLHKVADGLEGEFFPGSGRIEIITRFLVYYFGFEFIIRFFLQNTPVLFIQPYLHLPLKKGKIIHFMLRKSMVSVFNLLSLLLLIPFGLIVVYPEMGIGAFFGWTAAVFGLSLFNHFLGIYFKKKLNDQPNLMLILISVMLGVTIVEYFNIFEFSAVSVWIFAQFLEVPALSLIPVVLAIGFYQLNFLYLKNNTYPDEISSRKASRSKFSGDFAFLRRFGKIGEMVALELKMILRHKRPRMTLVFSGILLLYGLFFYTQDDFTEMSFIFIFAGIFVTGAFFINHGQFLLSWQSGDFDFLLTRNVSFRQYLESKYWLFVAVSCIAFVLSIGYVYFGWKIVAINFAACLFNIGINIPIVMRLSMFNPKKIDLNRGAAFNYEGMGAAQWLIGIPVLLLPYVLYLPFTLAGYENYGIMAVGVGGIIGFAFHKYVLGLLTEAFIKRRHKIAAGFRAQ